MYQKKKTIELLNKYKDKFVNDLGLKSWQIKFHVYRSDSKQLKKLGFDKASRTGNCGISFIGNKSADIVIFYNEVDGRDDCLGTIIHELLHVRFHVLTSLITLRADYGNKIEEKLVRTLERFILINGNFK